MQSKVIILANSSSGLYDFRKELIAELVNDYEVIAVLPDNEKVSELNGIGCHVILTPLERRGMNPIKDLGLFRRYFQLIKKEKPSLVITYTIKPNVYGGLVCRLLTIPYAANITGLGTTFQNQGLLRKIVVVLYKLGLKKAKVVYFENQENREILIDEGIVRENQTCLLNGAGVNLEHFSVFDYPAEDGATHFLFIGRVMQEKGVDELFGAMKKLYDEGFAVTLDVLGYYEEDYEKQIEMYTKEGWLRYHGYQKDVRPFIWQSHCFVLPSWHEGMANTNLECAASGRPVITSNIHGCKEAVIDGVSGFLCEKQNTESLYEVMKRFTELSTAKRREMGLAGRKHMEAVFDKKKVVAETKKRL